MTLFGRSNLTIYRPKLYTVIPGDHNGHVEETRSSECFFSEFWPLTGPSISLSAAKTARFGKDMQNGRPQLERGELSEEM